MNWQVNIIKKRGQNFPLHSIQDPPIKLFYEEVILSVIDLHFKIFPVIKHNAQSDGFCSGIFVWETKRQNSYIQQTEIELTLDHLLKSLNSQWIWVNKNGMPCHDLWNYSLFWSQFFRYNSSSNILFTTVRWKKKKKKSPWSRICNIR